jgi:membrane-associated phospholipid phosphatase
MKMNHDRPQFFSCCILHSGTMADRFSLADSPAQPNRSDAHMDSEPVDDSKKTTLLIAVIAFVSMLLGGLGEVGVLFPLTIRGFFLYDPAISHPLVDDTVPAWVLGFNFGVVGLIIAGMQWMRPRLHTQLKIRSVLLYFMGFGLALFFTDAVKNFVSELRPDFLARCQPIASSLVFANQSQLSQFSAFGPFVTSYECAGSASVVEEGRKAFPSGHSALGFFPFIFLFVRFYF